MTINCDMGEGVENEKQLMPFIHSVNIACGGHFGDKKTIKSTMQKAHDHGLKIGLHPSFPDKIHFGRVNVLISEKELKKTLAEQMDLGLEVATSLGVQITHIKPHGGLYNKLAFDAELSYLFLEVLDHYDEEWEIYGLSESLFLEIAQENGYSVQHEVFADRRYNSDKTLVSRSLSNAIILDVDDMVKQAQALITNRGFYSVEGQKIKVKADTICLHGDNENAVLYAKTLYQFIKTIKE